MVHVHTDDLVDLRLGRLLPENLLAGPVEILVDAETGLLLTGVRGFLDPNDAQFVVLFVTDYFLGLLDAANREKMVFRLVDFGPGLPELAVVFEAVSELGEGFGLWGNDGLDGVDFALKLLLSCV